MSPWARWVAAVERPIDARPAALARILLCLAILYDQLQLGWNGVVPLAYRNGGLGGLAMPRGSWYVMDELLGDPHSGEITWLLLLVATGAALVGYHARWAMLAVVVLSAQLGHGYHWDNGGDRIARTALLILALGGAATTWTWRDRGPRTMPAGSALLLRWFLVLVYVNAGLGKLFPRPSNWLSPGGGSITYRILVYPITSDLDPVFWKDWTWTMTFLDVATVVTELGAVLILTRWRPWWGLAGAPIHLGIWWAMTIDHFALVMLALYPLIFDGWLVALLARWEARGAATPS